MIAIEIAAWVTGAGLVILWIVRGNAAYQPLFDEYKLRGLNEPMARFLAARACVFPPVATYYTRKYRRERGADH